MWNIWIVVYNKYLWSIKFLVNIHMRSDANLAINLPINIFIVKLPFIIHRANYTFF